MRPPRSYMAINDRHYFKLLTVITLKEILISHPSSKGSHRWNPWSFTSIQSKVLVALLEYFCSKNIVTIRVWYFVISLFHEVLCYHTNKKIIILFLFHLKYCDTIFIYHHAAFLIWKARTSGINSTIKIRSPFAHHSKECLSVCDKLLSQKHQTFCR